jgi:hypothetical protein
MADKVLFCCMDTRFYKGTYNHAEDFFGDEFYPISVAGGAIVLVDHFEQPLGAWENDSALRGLKIVLDANPTTQVLLVAHVNKCKGYETLGRLTNITPEKEVEFQFAELQTAREVIKGFYPQAEVSLHVAEIRENGVMVFHEEN